ncbi:NADH-quinone oxidoreductase subunit N [Mycobacterium xenopi]|nr:NADH-quinone oxidoreductase subunit N [Mycobacterium xenopi]MDA3641298.1 NADH-quinone oxidoreductase subunit N [Mycobacterium xenopi]MDA3659042.1 NADH-quinone oxidoreductase subunit N [Mycobacterium xenopi]MDA3663509.1 NADH-quinone oxidoreductase subunit N [Mycobacterium xenopi]ORX18252.1 NADH-quinone oxidoreductase subunit N [Mycobacterium xenopi]
MRPLLMLPEMLVFAGGLVVMISGSFLAKHRQWWTSVIAAMVLAGATLAAITGMTGPDQSAFDDTFAIDTSTGLARIVAAIGALLVLAVAGDEIRGSPRESETYALLLFSTTGVLILAGADDLLVLITGFLLTSIPLYGLIGLLRSPTAAEATMKAYLIGALFGIVLMLGVSILYAVTGATSYHELGFRLGNAPAGAVAAGAVAVLAALMFEAGGVPAHFWVPDAAQGANGTAAMFLTTVPKIGALIALYRLATVLPDTIGWPLLVAVLAVASMTLGNLAAYWQQDPRRLLGWSTVSQVGFLLVPIVVAGRSDLALPSLLFYLAGYTLTNSAAFAVTTALPGRRDLGAYRGLARSQPCLAGALLVALLGLLGTPPTAVFVGKLTTATAAWDGGQSWLAVVVFVNSLISLFYYLRWIIPSFRQSTAHCGDVFDPKKSSSITAVLASGVSLALGISAGAVWQLLT